MRFVRILFSTVIWVIFAVGAISAQTTEFSYQGSLKDGVVPATGNYDFEFLLFDMLSGGAQQGSTLTRSPVAVSSGIFTVSLDFGSVFPGASRFLEIHVRPTGGGSFNTLTPRQQIDSAPYSVKSLTADNVPAAGIPAGSENYIQNQNAGTQASSNFSISGNGTAGGTLSGNIVNSATQYNINNIRILTNAGTANLFAGEGAGQSNASGSANSFFGWNAGTSNTTSSGNSFFGTGAGRFTTGGNNVFAGVNAGLSNTSGVGNTTIGYFADILAPNLTNATAIGKQAAVGASNSLVLGSINGINNANADTNVGIGTITPKSVLHLAGNQSNFALTFTNQANSPGRRGYRIAFDNDRLTFQGATDAGDFQYNDMSLVRDPVLGNIRLGINDTEPTEALTVNGNGIFYGGSIFVGHTTAPVGFPPNGVFLNNVSGDPNNIFRVNADSNYLHFVATSLPAAATGAGIDFSTGPPNGTSTRLSIAPTGEVSIFTLGSLGSISLCRNFFNQIAGCSSSLRYKTNFDRFADGMSFVRQLRPISFDWKVGGMRDVGFGAEDVEKIDPRFVTYNDKGEVEGVKYDRLSVAFVNAFKEQQTQIETQQSQIDSLKHQLKEEKAEIDALKALVCSQNPAAEVCRPKK